MGKACLGSTIECSHSTDISVGMELYLLLVNIVRATHM